MNELLLHGLMPIGRLPNSQGSGLGAKMAGGNPDPARGRSPDDFYATPDSVTEALNRHYAETLRHMRIWEPCAGNGAMAKVLAEISDTRVVCSDVAPRTPVDPSIQIGRADVFDFNLMPAVDAIITNPPFVLAQRMIQHLLSLDGGPPDFVALVLKATFWHASGRRGLFRQFPPTAVHPLTWRPDFQQLGNPTMEVIWCVWRRGFHTTTAYVPFDYPYDKRGR